MKERPINKEQMRSRMLGLLAKVSGDQRAARSHAACQQLIATPEFQKSGVVMSFLSMPHEIDTSDCVLAAWQQGKTVVAPKVLWKEKYMIPVIINSLEKGFDSTYKHLRNPVSGTPLAVEEIDLVIVPGLAFDKKGNRLGRGGAYYDRFFGGNHLKAVRCGLAYDQQIVTEVPVTPYDQPIDMLVTDEQVLYFVREGD